MGEGGGLSSTPRQSQHSCLKIIMTTNSTSNQALETFLSPADLLSVTSTGQETVGTSSSSSMQKAGEKDVHYIIFIHALQNGLFRIHIQEYEKTQTK